MRSSPATALAASFLAALAACGSDTELQVKPADKAAAAAPPPITAVNAATPANVAASAPASACTAPGRIELDATSFERSDVPAFTPQRLESFRQSAATAFRSAVEAACAAGEIDSARMAALHRLLIQSASGATETAFYEDAESVGAGTLVFQYVFAEEDLAVPEAADIRLGLTCWANPERDECAEREP